MATRLLPSTDDFEGGVQFNDNTIQYTADPATTVAWANVTGRDASGGWKTFYGIWYPGRYAGAYGNCGFYGIGREQHFEFAAGAGQTFDIYYYTINCTDCDCNCI